jgi:hypothetical protein
VEKNVDSTVVRMEKGVEHLHKAAESQKACILM